MRDCGGSGVNTSLRNAVAQGLVPGPRIYSAGMAISATGGHMDETDGLNDDQMTESRPPRQHGQRPRPVPAGRARAVQARRRPHQNCQHRRRARPEQGRHRRRSTPKPKSGPWWKPPATWACAVACHAHGAEGIKRAVRAGVTSIEHGSLMDDEAMQLMAKSRHLVRAHHHCRQVGGRHRAPHTRTISRP